LRFFSYTVAALLGWLWLGATAAEPHESGFAAALQATLQNHPVMSGKRADVSAKKFAIDSAQAKRYPSLSGQAGQRSDQVSPMSLRARQTLWAFGRIDSAIAYANADVQAELADSLRVQRQLLDQVAWNYTKANEAYRRQQIAQDNVASHDKLYQQIMRREQGQLASRADVRLAASRLMQAQAQRRRVDGELESALNDLLALTQVPVRVEPTLAAWLLVQPEPSQLEALALEHSAEMQHKLQLAERARAEVGLEQSADMPTVYIQAERNFNVPGYLEGTRYSVMIEANVEGMGLAGVGRTRASQARLQAALENVNVTRAELLRNLRSLLANQRLQADQMASYKASEVDVGELLASFQRQYEAGFKSWQEVLNMQREFFDQAMQRAQAESEWLAYTLRIKALTGELDAVAGVMRE